VLIGVVQGAEVRLTGSGTLVGPGRILTAAHTLKGRPLRVRLEGGAWVEVADVRQDDGLDVAVLSVQAPLSSLRPPAWLFDIPTGQRWEACGYPKVRSAPPSEALEQVGGTTLSCGRADGVLNLDVDVNPQVWGGLSGAGVWVDGRLAGVVRAEPASWSGKRLTAVPVAAFLSSSAARRALGLDEGDDRARLQARAQVVHELKTHPTLRAQLAITFPVADAADAEDRVADRLFDAPEATLLALDHAAHVLAEPKLVACAQRLCLHLLPWIIDWQSLVVEGRLALDAEGAFELPLLTPALVDAFMARIEGRAGRYRPAPQQNATYPEGEGQLRMDPTFWAPVLNPTEQAVQATVLHLELLKDLCGQLKITTTQDQLRRTRAFLRARAQDARPQVFYFVFDLTEAQHEPLWQGVNDALRKALPELRRLRLKGDLLGDAEYDLAERVATLLRREGQ